MAGAAADLTARLQAWADARDTDLGAARLRVVHERLLARMDMVAPLCWVVRGSRAIDLRLDGGSGGPLTSTSAWPGRRHLT